MDTASHTSSSILGSLIRKRGETDSTTLKSGCFMKNVLPEKVLTIEKAPDGKTRVSCSNSTLLISSTRFSNLETVKQRLLQRNRNEAPGRFYVEKDRGSAICE